VYESGPEADDWMYNSNEKEMDGVLKA